MTQHNQMVNLLNPETGDQLRTTRKVLETYYQHQGYVELEEEENKEGRAPFLEVSPSPIKSTRAPALRGAAKAAAEKKAKQ